MIDQHKSLSEKFLKKGFWLYLFSFIIAPIWYVIKIILSGELSVSEIGILYGIISLITLLSAYNDLWMTESLKHFIPQFVTEKRYDKVKSILFYALISQIFTSLIIASLFYFWADYISINYFKNIDAVNTLKVFAFFFVWLNVFQTINSFFLAIQDTFYHKITEMIRMLFLMISVLFIFFWEISSLLNYSYSWLVWLYIWLIVILIIYYKKYHKKYFNWEKILIEKKFIKKIIKYSLLVFIWVSAWTILWQIDMQMIIYLLWTTEAWYYTNYLSIIWIPFLFFWPIFSFLFPVFSELYSKWEIKKIKEIKKHFQTNFLAIWIMVNIFFFIFAEIIAFILFWEKFITSWIILKYSILLLIFNLLLRINFDLLAGIWRVKERVKIILIAIVFNIIMNFILINSIGVYWAALATWFGWLLIYILSEVTLWKKYFIWFDYNNIFKNLINLWVFWIWIIYLLEDFIWIKFYTFNIWVNWLNLKKYFLENWRLESFWYLTLFFIIWLWIFIWINYNQFRIFILEIKKLKRWN